MGSEYRYFLYHSRHKEENTDALINVWNSDSSSGTALPNRTTGSIPDQSVSSITQYTMTAKTIPFITTIEEGLYTVVMNLADNSKLTFKDVQIANDYHPSLHLTSWSETTTYKYNGSTKSAVTYVDICTSGIRFSGNYVEGKGYYGNGMWATTHTLYANRTIISIDLIKQDIDWITIFEGNKQGTFNYQKAIPNTVYSVKFRITYYTNDSGWSHTTIIDNNEKLFMFKGSYFYLGGDNSKDEYKHLFHRQSYVIGLEDNIINGYITDMTRTGIRAPEISIYKIEVLYELPKWNVVWDTGETNAGYTYITFTNPIPDDVNNIEIRLTIDTTLNNHQNYENTVLTYSSYNSFANRNGDNTIRYLLKGDYFMDIYECTRKSIKVRKSLGSNRGYMKKIEVLYL